MVSFLDMLDFHTSMNVVTPCSPHTSKGLMLLYIYI